MKNFFMILSFGVAVVGFALMIFDIFTFPYAGYVYSFALAVAGALLNSSIGEDKAKAVSDKEKKISDEDKKKIARLRNMLYVAHADGDVKKEELLWCLSIAISNGLDKQLAADVCDAFEYQNWKIYIPDNQQDLQTHISELLAVVMIDGKSNKKEKARLKELLIKFGADKDSIDEAIEQGLEKLKASDEFQALRKSFKKM